MHPSSTSSSSQESMGPINGGGRNINNTTSEEFSAAHMGRPRFLPPSSETSSISSEFMTLNININPREKGNYGLWLEGSIGGGGGASVVSSSAAASQSVRHSSSPAGFLDHLAHASTSSNDNANARASVMPRLNSQLSFTRQGTLSHISEESENVDNNGLNNAENDKRKSTHSYTTASCGVGASWEDANTIMLSMGPSKRPNKMSAEIINLNSTETQYQIQFSMPQTTMLEMSSMDKLLNIPQDSVACKMRAKRGCATHPRSIAERERRIRINEKLKKLQDLVPNMEKQTSYANMLDLAVQHIKGLQNQVQKLNKELENCTCGCRK
ncbi:hypothetical protein ACH5RR_031966 [Cinchona calisaya]|uniref:BHLH domain-containing protein n=1 Tax=Cinchona calisaya TaxID=153742 RepID=A0ABD2YJF9_9GENT